MRFNLNWIKLPTHAPWSNFIEERRNARMLSSSSSICTWQSMRFIDFVIMANPVNELEAFHLVDSSIRMRRFASYWTLEWMWWRSAITKVGEPAEQFYCLALQFTAAQKINGKFVWRSGRVAYSVVERSIGQMGEAAEAPPSSLRKREEMCANNKLQTNSRELSRREGER